MNNYSSTNSFQTSNQLISSLPSKQSVDLALNDCTWSTFLPINPTAISEKQHGTMVQPQQQLTSLSFTNINNQNYPADELFSPVENANWKFYAHTTTNHLNNTHPPLYDYSVISGSSTNDQAIIQSHGIFSPQSTTCYGMEKKNQDFVSNGASTTTPTLCNNMEDGVTLADGTSSSCTSSVVEDTYFSDGELGGNSADSSGYLLKTQSFDNERKQSIPLSTPNEVSDQYHNTAPLQEHDTTDQDQDSHCCRWANCTLGNVTLDELIGHIRETHIGSGKAAYHCEWIGCTRNRKPFMKRHKMHNHMRTHTGERPFVCTVDGCDKRFSRPDSLNTHMRTHSNIRPYICPVNECCKSYYHSRSLRKHVKGHEAAGITVPRSTPSNKRKHSLPKPTPSPAPPLTNEKQSQENIISTPLNTIIPSSSSTTPPLLSSCSDTQFLLFSSPSSSPPEWNSSFSYAASTRLLDTPIPQQQQAALCQYSSTFSTAPSMMNPTDIPLKPLSSNPGTEPLYPNPSCSFYDPLSLSYVYAPH